MADLIDRLATEHDHSPEEIRAIVEDIEADLDEPLHCPVCNELVDPPYVTVMAYPRPWADEEALRCQSCWAAEAEQHTDLSEHRATIFALKLAGFTNGEIGDVIGRAAGTVSATLSQIRHPDPPIDEQIQQLEHTRTLLGLSPGESA